jgi:hypothetical protein
MYDAGERVRAGWSQAKSISKAGAVEIAGLI